LGNSDARFDHNTIADRRRHHGSQAAIQAAEWAVDEAVSREVPLRLVEVITRQAEPAPLESVGNVRMELEYAETALRIASAAMAANAHPVKVETAVLRGDTATALTAESRDAEMICVGSVGIGRVVRALFGSTAAELAEAAHCPVAIIRTRQHRPNPDSDLIAVAVNDSPGNDDVVERAIKEAQLRHAPVLALGVWRQDLGEMPNDELDQLVHDLLPGNAAGRCRNTAATLTGVARYVICDKPTTADVAVVVATKTTYAE